MTSIRRGELRDFDPAAYALDTPPSDGLVILTEDDWNAFMRSSTVAGVFKFDQHPAPGDPTIVDLGQGDYVDCTQVFPVSHSRIGALWQPPLSTAERASVDAGVRLHLCIDQLLARAPEPHAPPARSWEPKQGMVRKVDWPPGDPHMIAVLSSTESNARLGTCSGVLLTSKTKTNRVRWEVPVPGGYTVVGDVLTVNISEVRMTAEHGKPDRLDPATMAAIAARIELALDL